VLSVLCSYSFSCTVPVPPSVSPLSLPDALPISRSSSARRGRSPACGAASPARGAQRAARGLLEGHRGYPPGLELLAEHLERDLRSEEHTSELQSLRHLVCRLLLEKKNMISKMSQ